MAFRFDRLTLKSQEAVQRANELAKERGHQRLEPMHLLADSTDLHAFETGSELRAGLSCWISYYNARRPHSALAGHTPDEAYGIAELERLAA